MSDFEVCDNIVSRGIAQLYYENGLPLAASASRCKENGLDISWLNVARQMQQQGFSRSRIVSEFRELLSMRPNAVDIAEIEAFCELDDEGQTSALWQFWSQHTNAERLLGL